MNKDKVMFGVFKTLQSRAFIPIYWAQSKKHQFEDWANYRGESIEVPDEILKEQEEVKRKLQYKAVQRQATIARGECEGYHHDTHYEGKTLGVSNLIIARVMLFLVISASIYMLHLAVKALGFFGVFSILPTCMNALVVLTVLAIPVAIAVYLIGMYRNHKDL